jgi:hypothetical protein
MASPVGLQPTDSFLKMLSISRPLASTQANPAALKTQHVDLAEASQHPQEQRGGSTPSSEASATAEALGAICGCALHLGSA